MSRSCEATPPNAGPSASIVEFDAAIDGGMGTLTKCRITRYGWWKMDAAIIRVKLSYR